MLTMASLGLPLVVQWLRLHTSNAGGTGSIPGQGTKIVHAAQHGQKLIKIKMAPKQSLSSKTCHIEFLRWWLFSAWMASF